jgi:hypothetical protein
LIIDLRGRHHPDHIREFKRHLEGFCTIHEEVQVLMENNREDRKRFEMFIRSCRAKYQIVEEGDYLRVKIDAAFSLCG